MEDFPFKYELLRLPVTERGTVQVNQPLGADVVRIRGLLTALEGGTGVLYGQLRLRVNEGFNFYDCLNTTFFQGGIQQPQLAETYNPFDQCDSGAHDQMLLKGTYELLDGFLPGPYPFNLLLMLLCETRPHSGLQRLRARRG